MKIRAIISSLIGILLLVIGSIWFWSYSNPSIPRGKIVLRVKDTPNQSAILVMDGNGNNIRWVGDYEGSPTWSPDGRSIAVGCIIYDQFGSQKQDVELCILDMTTLPDRRNHFFGFQQTVPDSTYQIQLPQLCKAIVNYGGGEDYSGILSISWSPDGENLAIVCGGESPESLRSVCIFSLDGNMSCWDDNISKDIYRVALSPVDKNIIAISGVLDVSASSKIYLVNPKGKNPVYLTDGSSPEWSPTGDEIAFIRDEPGHLGIATINKDGTGLSWLYQQPKPGYDHIYFDCMGFSGTCRLSWSPDKRFVTFASSNGDINSYKLYRLDVKTGDVTVLIDEMIYKYAFEPDWGP